MWNLQSILPAADTLSLAMTSSATDTAPHQDHPVCTLMTGTTQLKIWYQQGNMFVRKYPNLPIYLLGFSLGSFIVRTNADLTPYKKEILIGTGAQSAFLMRIMRTWIGKKYTGKMSCASDKIYDLMFGTYGKKFKGRPANYWLLTDNEKRREYADDSLVRQDVSPAFFCEFSKGMECASRNLKNPNNTIPTLFLYGKKRSGIRFWKRRPKGI